MCTRYPHHHCNRWCLAEADLPRMEGSPPTPGPINLKRTSSAGAAGTGGVDMRVVNAHAHMHGFKMLCRGSIVPLSHPDRPVSLPEDEVTTPHHDPISPRLPDAPSKSHSGSKSLVDRMFPSPAVRSLAPTFNLPNIARYVGGWGVVLFLSLSRK